MRVLITGAAGFIGSHIVTAVTSAGHEVVACTRPGPRHIERRHKPSASAPHIAWMSVDLERDTAADWEPRLMGIDAVINAAGIFREGRGQTFEGIHARGPIALFDACTAKGVRRIIQISALGADEGARSRFHLTKKRADDHLRFLPGVNGTIVQPSFVHGRGEVSMRFFKALAALPLIPLVGKGDQRIQPIHVDDLSLGIAELLSRDVAPKGRLAAVSPEPITFKTMLLTLRSWLCLKPTRTLPVPLSLMRLVSRIGDLVPRGPVSSDSLQMLQRGNTADPRPFVVATGTTPRSFESSLADSPATSAERLDARLTFLRPLLRLSIGFIWIATGVISAFVYPVSESYALLAQTGVTGPAASLALFGTSFFEIFIGLATIFRFHLRLMAMIQLAMILGFTLIISVALPEFWAHPFGPLTKNVPIVAATLVMIVLEEEPWNTSHSK